MLRQRVGSVVCPSCGLLVGVRDERCLNCGRWNPGMWGFAPLLNRFGRDLGFIPFVTGSCVVLYLLSLLIGGVQGGGFLSFLSPRSDALFMLGASGAAPVFGYGRWWTVLTAGWLHGGLLHILFNMMWVRNIGPPVAEFYGASRMVIIYTISGVAGFTASTLAGTFLRVPFFGAGLTVGASASIFGLLGALIYYGRRAGSSVVGEQAKSWAIMMAIFGFLFPGIDNAAHLGGLAGGYACARILDPLHPERLDHLVIALLCLGATAVAIVFSVVHALTLFGV